MHPVRYATFSLKTDPTRRLGLVRGDRIADISGSFPDGLLQLIRGGPEAWRKASSADGPAHPTSEIHWHAPIPRPEKNIFCLGLNYVAHAIESARARGREPKVPDIPVFFTKAPTTVNGPYDPIPVDPTLTQQVDYEVELAAILGRGGKNITRANALEHVFGYTILNDGTARDLQASHSQFFKGKSLDGFCPMGPVVVTADEFGDPQTKAIASRVNGETRQNSNTSDMIFSVAATIEWLSRGMTLDAGDIIATGTPEGVGIGRTPPAFLGDGDVVEMEIEGIGTIRNTIVHELNPPRSTAV